MYLGVALTVCHLLDCIVLHVFDALSGRELSDGQAFQHKTEIECVCISQGGSTQYQQQQQHQQQQQQRLLAFTDKNHDLYIGLAREKSDPVLLGQFE